MLTDTISVCFFPSARCQLRLKQIGEIKHTSFSTFESVVYRQELSLVVSRNCLTVVNEAFPSDSGFKRAKLAASKRDRLILPNYSDILGNNKVYHIREFLNHSSGIESILNKGALQSFQSLDSNTFRCKFPKIQFLDFEVVPVMDLRIIPTDNNCVVDLISCKLEGSETVERQNERFSASLRNHITWDANDSGEFLDIDVNLNLVLEIHTLPFSMLPVSAVEKPGNLLMQALLDRLVPLLLRQLLQDYDKWIKEQLD